MAEGGFDYVEMKNRNMEEEEEENERINEETSFNNDDDQLARSPRSHNNSINIINTSNLKSKYTTVDHNDRIPEIKKTLDL